MCTEFSCLQLPKLQNRSPSILEPIRLLHILGGPQFICWLACIPYHQQVTRVFHMNNTIVAAWLRRQLLPNAVLKKQRRTEVGLHCKWTAPRQCVRWKRFSTQNLLRIDCAVHESNRHFTVHRYRNEYVIHPLILLEIQCNPATRRICRTSAVPILLGQLTNTSETMKKLLHTHLQQ